MSSVTSTVQQQLQAAKALLSLSLPRAEAAVDAQILLMHVLGVNRAWLLSHDTDALGADAVQAYARLVQQRSQGVPVAHLLGYREFFGLRLAVTADTLIPRPDTETLVEAALAQINRPLQVLDLGTGTGAVALAIAHHAADCQVTTVDASPAALQVARTNAETLGIKNVQFLHSDWFSAVSGRRFDLIVSNPPYIESDDPHLQQGDLRFEPLTALASGADGLDDIRHIVTQARAHLHPQGWLMLEHGYRQAEAVQVLLAIAGFSRIATLHDLGDQPRVTMGCLTD